MEAHAAWPLCRTETEIHVQHCQRRFRKNTAANSKQNGKGVRILRMRNSAKRTPLCSGVYIFCYNKRLKPFEEKDEKVKCNDWKYILFLRNITLKKLKCI